jgi:hypothetical protein
MKGSKTCQLLFYALWVLYLCSLAGGQPIGQSLIALVPDFALLIAIRYTLFGRRLRLGKTLVGIGILIDWGFTAFFFRTQHSPLLTWVWR